MSQRRVEMVRDNSDPLNLKSLFDKFEVPWDESKSEEIFQRTLSKLEDRERGRKVQRARR